jgi:hypothetical protein
MHAKLRPFTLMTANNYHKQLYGLIFNAFCYLSFKLFQPDSPLRNAAGIFLTTLFYFVGAELRLVEALSLFWPLNGVMAGYLPVMLILIVCIITPRRMSPC